MNVVHINRRCVLGLAIFVLTLAGNCCAIAQDLRIATFDVDATPSVGMPMAYDDVTKVGELSLRCRGVVILGAGEPIVLAAIDWIGIANQGYDVFRQILADAADTSITRVAIHSLHQHDAPHCDFSAEQILAGLGLSQHSRFDGDFCRKVMNEVALAIEAALPKASPLTHIGWGSSHVEKIASNRRILGADGKVSAVRYTSTNDPLLKSAPEGTIDSELSMISFWNGEQAIAALSYYACHPQSYYRTGIPSPDFPGIARFMIGQSFPKTLFVHFNGASGNIGAGKYNDGSPENRMVLANRMLTAITNAWTSTKRVPIDSSHVTWNSIPVSLPVGSHIKRDELLASLKADHSPLNIYKAEQLAWLDRTEAGQTIDMSCLGLADIRVLHMPGELFVEYQLAAKAMRQDLHVAMAAYGDYGPWYIGTAVAYEEGGYETRTSSSNVAPEVEQVLTGAMNALLRDASKGLGQDLQKSSSNNSSLHDIQDFELQDGFQLQLVASEPNIIEPVVICYDENQVMYAAEFLKFPAFKGQSDRQDGRIRRLEDRDGDGYYESSQIFADQLAWPTGICPFQGGVFVISAPDLWYLKDHNQDGVADEKRLCYTGFGFTTEEGTANNLIWGLDQWIYGAGSNSDGEIIAPAQLEKSINLRGRDFRFNPFTGEFQAVTGSEQFGNCFDDWGNRYLCENSRPVVQVVMPSDAITRNPYHAVRQTKFHAWDNSEVFRASEPESWRRQRSTLRLQERPDWTGPSIEHDVFTACSGLQVYRGDVYPSDMLGQIFVGDVQGNLVHRRRFVDDSIAPMSVRIDAGTEFLRCKSNWFRPTSIVNAPDGTLHIVDMNREVIETPDSMPPEILAHVNFEAGKSTGRIYRLVPSDYEYKRPPALGDADTSTLLQCLESTNGWTRDTAARLLLERHDTSVVEPLRKLAVQAALAQTRIQALWLLKNFKQLTDDLILTALRDEESQVVVHAISLCSPDSDAKIVDQILKLSTHESSRVQFNVALTLGTLNSPLIASTLSKMFAEHADNIWISDALLISALPYAGQVLLELHKTPNANYPPSIDAVTSALAGMLGRTKTGNEILDFCEQWLTQRHIVPSSEANLNHSYLDKATFELMAGLRRTISSDQLNTIFDAKGHKSHPNFSHMITEIRHKLSPPYDLNQLTSIEDCGRLLEWSLLTSTRQQSSTLIWDLLNDDSAPQHLKDAAVRYVTFLTSTQFLSLLDSRFPTWTQSFQQAFLDRAIPDNTLAHSFVKHLITQPTLVNALSGNQRLSLLRHGNADIAREARVVLGEAINEDRQSLASQYVDAIKHLSSNVSLQRGREVFQKNCVACHLWNGDGHDLGPPLSTVQNAAPEQIVTHILAPNLVVQPNFRVTTIQLATGRVESGIVLQETPVSLTLSRGGGSSLDILKVDVDDRRMSDRSLMPEGFESTISPDAMRDLVEYIRAGQQVKP